MGLISGRGRHAPVSLLVLVAAAAFCPSGGRAAAATTVQEATPPSADEIARRLCDALHAVPERRRAECCAAPASASLAGACAIELAGSLRAGVLTLALADVERCAAETARALDGCAWVTPRLAPAPAACRGIVHGRLDLGARCRSSLECRDGLRCVGGDASVAGVCVPPGRPGDSCDAVPDELATHARETDDPRHPSCAGFCLRGRCAALAAEGGACAGHRECATGLHCVSGRCVAGPPPSLGEPCDGAACGAGLLCIDGRCARPKAAGESCTSPFECAAACVSGTCGMQCRAWPPAGYTPPTAGPVSGRVRAPRPPN